jgi:predicted kinase
MLIASGYPLRHGVQIAPVTAGVLQASYMRKWMSERLKRRKKPAEGATKEATNAPEPLQPRFYDNEPAAANEIPAETSAPEPVAPSRTEAEVGPDSEPVSASAATATPRPRTGRRRRSRGGRSGSRSRPAIARTATTAETGDVDASAPELSAPGAAEQSSDHSTPTASSSAPARASKGTVILAIGLPGSGKSSWFKRHNIHPLSSDLLRELLFDDAQEQRFQDLVFSNLRSMLKARLIARRPLNYVDATNLTPHDRHSWIKLAKDYGYDVQGLFFDVPLEVCMERHQRRGRAVPEDIMRKMAAKLKAPTFDEGFSKITVVRVKQKEAAAG